MRQFIAAPAQATADAMLDVRVRQTAAGFITDAEVVRTRGVCRLTGLY